MPFLIRENLDNSGLDIFIKQERLKNKPIHTKTYLIVNWVVCRVLDNFIGSMAKRSEARVDSCLQILAMNGICVLIIAMPIKVLCLLYVGMLGRKMRKSSNGGKGNGITKKHMKHVTVKTKNRENVDGRIERQ